MMRAMRGVAVVGLVGTGCAALGFRGPADPPPGAPPPAISPETAPATPGEDLYPLDEAIADVLLGPWEYMGTGPWHGNHRVMACAYRNGRVIVVNALCTIREAKAFRIDVYSPARGWVRVYAEARAPVSTVTRREYFSFNAETQPPPRPGAGLPPLALAMSFAELQRYEERRYERFLPACYGGVEVHRARSACLGDLAPEAARWAERNRPFLDHPPDGWYEVVRQVRALAAKHGRNVE